MINIVSPINQLGYGITGLNIVKSLSSITDVSLICISQPQVTNTEDAKYIQEAIQKAQFLDFDAPCIKIWHQHDMSQFAGRGKRIGFPIFELDEFTELEKHHLNSLDKIFVCSSWAKQIVLNNLPSKKEEQVCVIPLGVDTSIFKPSSLSHPLNTVFFNCGKWEVRKGHDVLWKIFNTAFNENDNVELWMMCNNPFLNETQVKEFTEPYTSSKLASKIKFIPRMSMQQDVYNIMSKTDCGIFPSRAEGWNLELLEMMACGKNVITTNYSAHTQFCNTNNSKLVDIKNNEIAYDGMWFHGKHGKWASIGEEEIEQFAQHMRDIHNLKQSKLLKTNDSGIETANQHSWSNSARIILNNV